MGTSSSVSDRYVAVGDGGGNSQRVYWLTTPERGPADHCRGVAIDSSHPEDHLPDHLRDHFLGLRRRRNSPFPRLFPARPRRTSHRPIGHRRADGSMSADQIFFWRTNHQSLKGKGRRWTNHLKRAVQVSSRIVQVSAAERGQLPLHGVDKHVTRRVVGQN